MEPDSSNKHVVELRKCTNLDFLNQCTLSDPVLIMEMISLYLKQTPPLIAIMRESLLKKDWTSLEGAAHKLIPSFSIVGIHVDYENAAKKIEEYARLSIPLEKEMMELIQKIEDVCEQAYKELVKQLNAYKGIRR